MRLIPRRAAVPQKRRGILSDSPRFSCTHCPVISVKRVAAGSGKERVLRRVRT